MKKFVFFAALAASTLVVSTPSFAQDANYWMRVQERNDPAYNHNGSLGPVENYGTYGAYGAVPQNFNPYWNNEVQIGRTKVEKNPQNRFQFCNGAGWVPFGQSCSGGQSNVRPVANTPAYTGKVTTIYIENGKEITETRMPNGDVTRVVRTLPLH